MLSWLGTKDVNQLIARGQYGKAVKVLEEQLREDPDSVHLRQMLADVLARDGQKRRAVEVLESLVQEYSQEGFLTKAIAVVKKVQRIDPEQADAGHMLETLVQMKHKNSPTSVLQPPSIPSQGPAVPPAPASTATNVAGTASQPEPPQEEYEAFKTSTLVLSEIWFEAAADQRKDFNWSPLFRDFSKSELSALVGGLRLLVKQPGSIIFTEGEPGASMFVLANGRARIYKRDGTGHNDQLAVMQEGEIFGVPSILDRTPRTATVTAINECELLELDQRIYEDIAATFPRIRKLVEELRESRVF